MEQKTTLEIIAPTVEEAIAQGLAQLGLTADAVSVEVLDAGNKGFFGLGKPQVRVRLTVNPVGGPSLTPPGPVVAPKAEPKREEKRVEKKPAPAPERKERPAPAPRSEQVETAARPPEKPAPVVSTESQPEHDEILDHAEAVV